MAGAAPTAPPRRDEVPAEQRWNAESVYPTPADWDAAYARVEAALPDAAGFRGRLGDPEGLEAWFAFSEGLAAEFGKLLTYAVMDSATDALDQEAVGRMDRARDLGARLDEAGAFARPELLALGADRLEALADASPALAPYRHLFERLVRQAEHTRSPEVEALLGALAGPFGSATQAHGVLANTDLDFAPAVGEGGDEHEITQSTIGPLLASPDRALRESAYRHYADAHLAFRNTMATLLGTGVKQTVFLTRARRYDSPLEMALAPEGLPLSVFHSLIDTFRAHLPTWHRYWRAKRAMLGVETLHPWDVAAPMTPSPPEVPFERALDWLADAMAPLGDEYVAAMRRGVQEERWVDRAPNRGKRMGAFSAGAKGTHPFIMMSHSPDVFGMSTLAHELGHSMHSYFTRREQPWAYSRYSLFVAEVASNFNQAMLRAHLFERFQGDRDMQIALIEEAMANFYRYFFVMPTLARFELEIHERGMRGEAMGADRLVSLMAELFGEGYGDEVAMDEARVGITWAQFHTHLYARFYVYQYATGIAGAHALAAPILAGDEGASARYLDFLKAGGSLYPLDALRAAGVDLSGPAPVEETFAVLAGLVDRLEGLSEG